MKFNEENIKKLREGKALLVNNHSKPGLLDAVLKEAFPKDKEIGSKFCDFKYFYAYEPLDGEWDISNVKKLGELIPLKHFFESEEVSVEEINFKSYKPKTAEERDNLVKELQAMEFKKELPSELPNTVSDEKPPNFLEYVLLELLRMRDVYRDGWISDTVKIEKKNHVIRIYKGSLDLDYSSMTTRLFSFQDEETAELFLKNFRKELEQIKHLIS